MAAPTRCTILYENVITADTEYYTVGAQSAFPDNNLFIEDIHTVCRTSGESVDGESWRIDTNSIPYDTVMFAGHNLTVNADVKCKDGPGYYSNPDLVMTRGVNCYVYYWDTPPTDRYLTIETIDTTGDVYHEIGIIWIGMRLELARNPQIPMGLIIEPGGLELSTIGGQQWGFTPYTKHGFKLKFETNFEASGAGMYASLEAMYDDRGMSKPFFIDIKPGDSNTPPLFGYTTDWNFSIDGKDARPGTWTIEQEL